MDYDLSFSDLIDKVANKLFSDQWIVLYRRFESPDGLEELSTYSGLIRPKNIMKALSTPDWERLPDDGIFGITESHIGKKKKISYTTYHDDITEPLVYIRDFQEFRPPEKCILDELVLFFNLYKKTSDREDHFIFMDDNGNEIIAIVIGQDEVRILKKFLFEYLHIKKMWFVFYYDMMRYSGNTLKNLGLNALRTNVITDNANYSLCIDEDNQFVTKGKSSGYILGKHIIALPKEYRSWYYDADRNDKEYESFIIGEDEIGNPKKCCCNPNNLSNNFGKNKGNPHYLTPVYFKLDVMQKYYNNTSKYRVRDSMIELISRWSLRIDNNHSKAIVVFLGDLGKLPTQEQKYWQSYNISPLGGISRVAFRRGILAEFTEPEAPDLLFKRNLADFYDNWYSYFNWHLFKPLNDQDAYRLESLHIPSNDSEIDFKNQVEAIAILLCESLNVESLRKIVGTGMENEKSISLLERYLLHIGFKGLDFIAFLRNLNTLRNLKLHRQASKSYKKINGELKKACEFFDVDMKTNSEIITMVLVYGSGYLYDLLTFTGCLELKK